MRIKDLFNFKKVEDLNTQIEVLRKSLNDKELELLNVMNDLNEEIKKNKEMQSNIEILNKQYNEQVVKTKELDNVLKSKEMEISSYRSDVDFVCGLVKKHNKNFPDVVFSDTGDFFTVDTFEVREKGLHKDIVSLLIDLNRYISIYNSKIIEISNIENNFSKLEVDKERLLDDIMKLQKEIEDKNAEIMILDDELLYQNLCLYTPSYNCQNSYEYKEMLKQVRDSQKEMIKLGRAATCSTNWIVENSYKKGEQMTKNNIKQVLRCFNSETETIINRVKFGNVDKMKDAITKSFTQLNKMNKPNLVEISEEFLNLKLAELHIVYEYELKKQEEREEQRIIKERMREEKRVLEEIEKSKKNIIKDISHYSSALDSVLKSLANETIDVELKNNLLIKQVEIEAKIDALNSDLRDIDYRQQNQKAGYVYIISNIGSFGENKYKIGMTRRLNPFERVDELGGASVPFKFDVHAMIFSDDAPKLENLLHKAFETKRVNMVNPRREFFEVSLDEIEKTIKENFDKTVEFTKTARAEQYRETLAIKKSMKAYID